MERSRNGNTLVAFTNRYKLHLHIFSVLNLNYLKFFISILVNTRNWCLNRYKVSSIFLIGRGHHHSMLTRIGRSSSRKNKSRLSTINCNKSQTIGNFFNKDRTKKIALEVEELMWKLTNHDYRFFVVSSILEQYDTQMHLYMYELHQLL